MMVRDIGSGPVGLQYPDMCKLLHCNLSKDTGIDSKKSLLTCLMSQLGFFSLSFWTELHRSEINPFISASFM